MKGLVLILLLYIISMQVGCLTMRTPDRKWPKELAKKGQRTPVEFIMTERDNGDPMHGVSMQEPDSLPVVVCVHGSPGSADAYMDYFTDTVLTERIHLVAVDRPGFGYSHFGHPEPSLHEQAKAIKAIMDRAVPGRKVVLVGHSLGGPLVLRFAMDFPHVMQGLVVVAGSVDPDLEPHPWWQKPIDHWPLRWLIPRSMWTSNHEIIALEAELRQMLPLWSSIHCPVRILHATDDRLVPFANAQFAVDHLTGVEDLVVDTMQQGDHFILWNHRQRVVDAILDIAYP